MRVELRPAIRVIDKKIALLKSQLASLSESRRILLDTKDTKEIEVAPAPREVKKRRLSAEARKTISAAQRKRWATFRATHAKGATNVGAQKSATA
jgi:hypothetical protein